MNLVELRRRYVRVLDKNRNQRQVLTLLVHYAQMLQQNAAAARNGCVLARMQRQTEAVSRISRSFVLLSRTNELLEYWRSS